MADKVILGIDPGTTIMGYGIILCDQKKMEFVSFGVIHLKKYREQMLKLKHIFSRSVELIENYHPTELAIESQFFGKNVQSMLKLGRAQGIAISAALYKNIPVFEYSPRKIKQAITGSGNASKEQVAKMLTKLLNMKEVPEYLDSTDALAVAVAHFFQGDKIEIQGGDKYSGWDAFVKNNPNRVKRH